MLKWFFQGQWFHASRHKEKSRTDAVFSNLQFRSPDDAATYVWEKTKDLNNSLWFLYHAIPCVLDMVSWEYSKQLRPNIALLYSQTGDTKDISASHMLLSCIIGRRLNKDKNGNVVMWKLLWVQEFKGCLCSLFLLFFFFFFCQELTAIY